MRPSSCLAIGLAVPQQFPSPARTGSLPSTVFQSSLPASSAEPGTFAQPNAPIQIEMTLNDARFVASGSNDDELAGKSRRFPSIIDLTSVDNRLFAKALLSIGCFDNRRRLALQGLPHMMAGLTGFAAFDRHLRTTFEWRISK